MTKQKRKPPIPERKTKVVGASLTPADLVRLEAYGVRMLEKEGLRAKPGTLVAMLVRKGLDAVEAGA